MHLFRDTDSKAYLGGTIGKGLVSIRACSPYDLLEQAPTLQAKLWSITKAEADQLLANVQKDEKEGVNYLLTGRTPQMFQVEAYSCLSWCEKHLQLMGIDAINNKKWYDYVCHCQNIIYQQPQKKVAAKNLIAAACSVKNKRKCHGR